MKRNLRSAGLKGSLAAAGLLAALLLARGNAGAAELLQVNGAGRPVGIYCGETLFPISANLVLYPAGGERLSLYSQARLVEYARQGETRSWRGEVQTFYETLGRYRQAISPGSGGSRLLLEFTLSQAAGRRLEGAQLFLFLPAELLEGGRAGLPDRKGRSVEFRLPAKNEAESAIGEGLGNSFRFEGPAGRLKLSGRLDGNRKIRLGVTRSEGQKYYWLALEMAAVVEPGATARLELDLTAEAKPDRRPVRIKVNPGLAESAFQGFGGNLCFWTDPEPGRRCLEEFRLGRVRLRMGLDEWEPENDNGDPERMDLEYFRRQDRPGSRLREEFQLAAALHKKGIPVGWSVWKVPGWIAAGNEISGERCRIAADRWPELVESIAAYLLYARQEYGVEAEFFSFNEPDVGVQVLLSPEEHALAVNLIGGRLSKLGLKTRILVGDVYRAAETIDYPATVLAKPELLPYAGGLAFHAWGGARPEEYRAWKELADRHRLPLLVTEAGTDASAYLTRWYIHSFHYAVQELRLYQELLRHARPQSIMEWQYTDDYGPLQAETGTDTGPIRYRPTLRYAFLKQFVNLTPAGLAVASESDRPEVLVTAFSGRPAGAGEKSGRILTIHIANLGPGRTATLTGLPETIKNLKVFQSDETAFNRAVPAPVLRDGTVSLNLPPFSLTSLTDGDLSP
ncbi:MAG TPA: hypothetical protein PKM61_07290 [bacterium]|uniref:O-Glycosyl hydrolase family 30 n=1 Tax=candidate division TA06 bacterium ADurb.Bin417 TaxID=1852828 RepID=A0A1V5MKP4_UNCT6|nr:MAG: hypothetical protein BWY73_00112 [candidate division TA06 bacterium ADurb.Bin417]HNS49312.1 hypothetical protein [bacterium]